MADHLWRIQVNPVTNDSTVIELYLDDVMRFSGLLPRHVAEGLATQIRVSHDDGHERLIIYDHDVAPPDPRYRQAIHLLTGEDRDPTSAAELEILKEYLDERDRVVDQLYGSRLLDAGINPCDPTSDHAWVRRRFGAECHKCRLRVWMPPEDAAAKYGGEVAE